MVCSKDGAYKYIHLGNKETQRSHLFSVSMQCNEIMLLKWPHFIKGACIRQITVDCDNAMNRLRMSVVRLHPDPSANW